jgi:hypothetical protein
MFRVAFLPTNNDNSIEFIDVSKKENLLTQLADWYVENSNLKKGDVLCFDKHVYNHHILLFPRMGNKTFNAFTDFINNTLNYICDTCVEIGDCFVLRIDQENINKEKKDILRLSIDLSAGFPVHLETVVIK